MELPFGLQPARPVEEHQVTGREQNEPERGPPGPSSTRDEREGCTSYERSQQTGEHVAPACSRPPGTSQCTDRPPELPGPDSPPATPRPGRPPERGHAYRAAVATESARDHFGRQWAREAPLPLAPTLGTAVCRDISRHDVTPLC
jgi:hypothetical protein